MSKKEASQMRFANEALNSYNIKMQYTSQAQVKIRVYQHTEMRSKMADLNELNEKVEQIKADIREQLEKIDLYFVIIHVDCLVIHTYFFLFFLLLYSFFFYDAQRVW